jgi:Uma2 family endonuclease
MGPMNDPVMRTTSRRGVMATATEAANPRAPSASPGLPEGVHYQLSADDYFRMVEADIIPRDRRVGLWAGQLYEKMAKKLPHAVAQSLGLVAVIRALPEGWFVWLENPFLVDDFTAPLPDLTVARGTADDYVRRGSWPKAGEIGLVVELADTSLRKNLTETLRTYARAGLPWYWVVNLVAQRVEVYSRPEVAGYAASEAFEAGKDIPLMLDGREVARIPARDLLPEESP